MFFLLIAMDFSILTPKSNEDDTSTTPMMKDVAEDAQKTGKSEKTSPNL